MSIIETALIFAGIPALVIVLVAGAVYAGAARRGKRYRPGRSFEFTPVWFLSAPEEIAHVNGGELTGANRLALPASQLTDARAAAGVSAGEWPPAAEAHKHVTGGASDRW